jgi:hypothetical protein
MKTSPTTSEAGVRAALLDVLHAQWREFGVPFNVILPGAKLEVIDPEELVWCSLEFTSQEPRLAEGVRAWVTANRTRINRQRLNKLVRTSVNDQRSELWHALENAAPSGAKAKKTKTKKKKKPLGNRADGPSTLLLRSRDTLGNDCRSFLIAHLIGNPRGVRLREVSKATGYSYRSISEAASSWERAGVSRIKHGYCVLVNPAPWCELLGCTAAKVVVVDWHATYQASIELVRTLAKARALGFSPDHPLVISAIRTADAMLEIAAGGADRSRTPTHSRLRDALAVEWTSPDLVDTKNRRV